MKKFDVEVKKAASMEPLPAGGYVARILNAKVDTYDWGEVLVISFDIAEGEYKNFFADRYRNDTNENKRWRGNYRINVPNEKNQYFASQKRAFGNLLWAVEESNDGYNWSWDEASLKGKHIGVLFRNREYDFDGRQGWTTECCSVTSTADVRNGNFKMPKDKPLAIKPVKSAEFEEMDEAEDLPF